MDMNHYFDTDTPVRPYTHSLPANPGTLPPGNALRGEEPPITKGFWPCEKDGSWVDVEDHRERTLAKGFPAGTEQEGTKFWLPENTHQTPARKMTDIGPLPEGAVSAPPEQPLEEARAAKLAAIVAGANAVKASLSARFSLLEEATWPEQEAGARTILGDAGNVKDKTARLILLDAASTAAAVELVARLAAIDGDSPPAFAARIAANADMAHLAGITTLLEQRALEAAAHAAKTREELRAVTAAYSLLSPPS